MPASNKFYSLRVPARLFWSVYVPVAVGVLIAAAGAGIFLVDTVVMPRIVGINRGIVVVPGVTGLALEEGREKLYAAGLLTEIKSRQFDEMLPRDAIVTQFPAPGEKVKKGRRILVVVSKGGEFAEVPRLKDLNEHQARVLLKKNGFTVGEVTRKYDEKQAADLVMESSPSGGTTISRSMPVDFVISRGPKPTTAEMPNIVGETVAEARKKVEECGLKVGRVQYRNDPSLAPGTVVSQSVPPGDNVPFGGAVDMTVSVIQ